VLATAICEQDSMASRGERMTVIGVDPSPQPSCRILVGEMRWILAYDALTTDSALIPQVFAVPGLPALPKETVLCRASRELDALLAVSA
jgi:hypothetical protein